MSDHKDPSIIGSLSYNSTMTIAEPEWVQIDRIVAHEGILEVLELPFEARRTYFIQKVPHGAERGFHAHRSLRQILFAPQGSFEIDLITSYSKRSYSLNALDGKALMVPPGYWRVISNFSEDAICMVIASEHYEEADYIRNFEEYDSWFKRNFDNVS